MARCGYATLKNTASYCLIYKQLVHFSLSWRALCDR